MAPKAKRTRYDGYWFRSLLEARWAVFFNTLGVPYEYEPQHYDLGEHGIYWPDFWLPRQQAWVEIKGVEPTEAEQELMAKLVSDTENRGFIFWGPIPNPDESKPIAEENFYSAYLFDDWSWDSEDNTLAGLDMSYQWCECPKCGYVDIQFAGLADRNPCGCRLSGRTQNAYSPRLQAAYTAARSFDLRKKR